VLIGSSCHRQTATDTDHLTGDERGGIGGEEQHRGGDFLWPGQSAKWDRFDQSLFQLLGLGREAQRDRLADARSAPVTSASLLVICDFLSGGDVAASKPYIKPLFDGLE
jgi:hypothetical protein